MRREQLDYIKQEHRIFSAYLKAVFPDNTNDIVSSLVCGDDFVHIYTFTLWDEYWPMVVHTYSRHGDTFRGLASWEWAASNPVATMGGHLVVRGAL